MNAGKQTGKRAWLKGTVLALGVALLITLLPGCGEGTLPPPPPAKNGTINLYGEAV